MKLNIRLLGTITRKLCHLYSEHKIASLSAALAYYMLFSFAPLLLICITVAGFFYDPVMTQSHVLTQIQTITGAKDVRPILALLEHTHTSNTSMAHIMSFIAFIFGASGIFNEIQRGLNTIWGVKARSNRGLARMIKDRFLSFTMVFGIVFLFLISMLLSTFLATIKSAHPFVLMIEHNVLYGLIAMFTLVLMFKILPDVSIQWRDVWLGAFITAMMLTLGKILLAIYLSHTSLITAFGAGSALIIVLIWIYYSAQIFFIGAELTKMAMLKKGKPVIPSRQATPNEGASSVIQPPISSTKKIQ